MAVFYGALADKAFLGGSWGKGGLVDCLPGRRAKIVAEIVRYLPRSRSMDLQA
jgi:hypothetical protein